MGQTLERMKEGYSQIRNEALAYAFSYMNLIEHWGSGIPRIIGKVKAAGLREPEFIGGEVDLRINIYRGQIEDNSVNNAKNGANGVKNDTDLALNKEGGTVQKLLSMIAENPTATQAHGMQRNLVYQNEPCPVCLFLYRNREFWFGAGAGENQTGRLGKEIRS